MSECVVRMEMPQNNCEMAVEIKGVGDWCPIVARVCDYYSTKKMPDWCPIICQLPEGHGELIERQPIIQFIEDGLNRGEYGHDQIEVMTEVFVAETIVPAEAERSE